MTYCFPLFSNVVISRENTSKAPLYEPSLFKNLPLFNHLLLSGAVMSVLPIMVVFLLNQKTFIAGMAAGSVKG